MKRFFLLGTSVSFSCGIATGLFLDWDTAWVWALLCVVIIIAWGIVFRKENILFIIWLGACVLSGASGGIHSVEHYRTLEEQENLRGIGKVRGEMSTGVFDAHFVLEAYDCEERVCPREYILVRTGRYETLTDGMTVHFGPCDLKRPERFDSRFDYPMYLAKEGIGFVARGCPIEPVAVRGDRLRSSLHETRVFISSVIEERIPEPEAGLARGLLLGGSDELPEALANDFRIAGLSHIVAVSGYNISVLAGGLFLLGVGLGWYRKRAVWGALFGTVLFVLLVGAPASAVRAALVSIVGFVAFSLARPIPTTSILCFAAASMLFWNPLLLRYDVGFQLSFLATFAILFSAPWRNRFSKSSWLTGKFSEALLLTLSVLLFVTPVTLIHFGTLSPYALVANILALPLIPAAFLSSLCTVVLGWIPGIGAAIGWIAYGMLHGLVAITETVARLPGASASYAGIRWWGVIIWYGICLSFFFWQHRVAQKSREKGLR